MQIVLCVRWSHDDKYIVLASDEMNLRLWKSRASEKLGVVSTAQFLFVTRIEIIGVDLIVSPYSCGHVRRKLLTTMTS